ncbi:hypothetical protein AVEN_226059-1 [Araneus ventricosus]|uniref:Uncharacterized protein n=1 Tax=Araneus ventricosus TaxID=182803 RepID=A0A4Y2IIR4_ARAVE|nr:hypothetical protein AVEN_226059-1 [Araneus ventricosus]
MKPEGLSEKAASEWEQKNSDAVAIILALSDEQVIQFAAEHNAKILIPKIKSAFTVHVGNLKIDSCNELKNLQMKTKESANVHIARAVRITAKCHSLGLDVSSWKLIFYNVRGLKGKFAKVRDISKTHHDKSIYEILEILREEEACYNSPTSPRAEVTNAGVFIPEKEIPV